MQQKILFLLTVRRMLLLEFFFFLLFLFFPRKPLLIDHVDGFPVTRDGSKKYGTHTLIRGSRKRFVYQKPPLIHATCAFSTISERTKTLTYANVYRNTINDGDSQTSPLPIFPEGGGNVCTQASKVSHFSRRGRAPSRLPMKTLISLLQKTRKVRAFVWKSIRKNTPLSSKIHCYVKNRNGLDLNRYRSNCNSVRFLLKGQLQN